MSVLPFSLSTCLPLSLPPQSSLELQPATRHRCVHLGDDFYHLSRGFDLLQTQGNTARWARCPPETTTTTRKQENPQKLLSKQPNKKKMLCKLWNLLKLDCFCVRFQPNTRKRCVSHWPPTCRWVSKREHAASVIHCHSFVLGCFFLFFHWNEFEWLCVTLPLRPWRLSPCRRAAASSTPRWTSKLPAGRPSAAPGRRKRRREPLTQPAVPSMMGRWSTPSWPSTSELLPSLGESPF